MTLFKVFSSCADSSVKLLFMFRSSNLVYNVLTNNPSNIDQTEDFYLSPINMCEKYDTLSNFICYSSICLSEYISRIELIIVNNIKEIRIRQMLWKGNFYVDDGKLRHYFYCNCDYSLCCYLNSCNTVGRPLGKGSRENREQSRKMSF